MFFGGDPFEGMGGMGGRRSSKPVDTTGLYKTLGVEKNASADEIRKAYRKLAIKLHPDKPTGDEAKFKEVQTAFDVLGDEQKRTTYDQYGLEGLENGGGGGGGGADLFDMLSGRGRRGPPAQRKGDNMTHSIKMTLEQAYTGSTRKLKITRRVIDRQKGVRKCQTCGGQGAVIKTVRMGPMIQQMQSRCEACGGKGMSFDESNMAETLEVHTPKGAPDGYKAKFAEKADEIPDGDAGDVIITHQEQPHPVFKRHGDDLYVERTVTLTEALCGFKMELKHLDGRTLLIKTKPGEVIKPVTYDPFRDEEGKQDWDLFEGYDVPSLDDAAAADSEDLNICKKACASGQLKGRGIGAFVQSNGRTTFKQCTTAEALAAKKPRKGVKLYILRDPTADASKRMMKAVEGEGMPRHKNPIEHGNLFILITIEFPTSIDAGMAEKLRALLPPPPATTKLTGTEEDVELVELTDMDPLASYKQKIQIEEDDDSDDERRRGGGGGGGGVQCAQQ